MKYFHPNYFWYAHRFHPLSLILLPFSWIFAGIVKLRQWLYRTGLRKVQQMPVPVIVVGNVTTGGTGKTPFVIWLAQFLRAQGYKPGIVSRGVGGKKFRQPVRVQTDDDPKKVGDEAIVLMRKTQCPLVIGVNRAAAAAHLLQTEDCDIVISDDGMQHYRLGRTIEVMMIDPVRGFGNGRLLPAGPLRESPKKMRSVDFVIANNGKIKNTELMLVLPTHLVRLCDKSKMPLQDFSNRTIHAVAGIGHPERFFALLRNAGFHLIQHVFPDHHHYRASDLNFADDLPIVMTYKDAVKCHFAVERYWYLETEVSMSAYFQNKLLGKLRTQATFASSG